MIKLYFFGGAFDPPHIGHYNIVNHCLKECDKLIVIPSNIPVDKSPAKVSASHRFNMLEILFSDLDVIIDDYEINSIRENYTFYTIEYLLKKYTNSEITMVIGHDQAINFHNWYQNDKIKNMVNILCFNRKVSAKENKIDGFIYNSDFNFEISSSNLRKYLKDLNYSKLRRYIQPEVLDYIMKNNLYV